MTELSHIPSIAAEAEGSSRALVLAGGGIRVAYQAGVIQALIEAGLRFTHLDGTSGGILNTAMLLSGIPPAEMCARWRTLDVTRFMSPMPLRDYLDATDLMGMGDADGIVGSVFPHLGIDVARIRAARGLEATFNVCNFTRKTLEAIPHTRVDRDLLVAGLSLPGFMPPVRSGDALYVDAVWIKDANLIDAVRRGARELWLVWCVGNSGVYKGGLFHQYVHMIELSANGALFGELDQIREINARIRRGEAVFGHTEEIVLHVIRPEVPLPLDPDFVAGCIDAGALIGMGYDDARRYLAERSPAGLPLTPDVTRMRDERPGLSFRETLAGTLASTGLDLGPIVLHLAIRIDDLEAFLREPGHTARLVGHLELTGTGEAIPFSHGAFHRVQDPDRLERRTLAYSLRFRHQGREYFLSGRKVIEDDPGFDLWADHTRLITRLHEGIDATGPVVGEGELTLDVVGVAKLVSSLHASNVRSAQAGLEAVSAVGRSLLGGLWDIYGRHAP